MNDNRFSEQEIASILKQYDEGNSVDDLCRKHEISLNTLYRWKARYGGTDSLLGRLDELELENYRLKGVIANSNIQSNAKQMGDTDHIYRILASNIPGSAITILDREERYLLAEGDFLATMGYSKQTMPGKKISEVISPENYNEYFRDAIRALFNGETIFQERRTPLGYDYLMKAVPLRNGSGGIFAIMFALTDITSVKKAQAELAKLNEALETKVSERTEQLKEANRQLESFSYSVSHDLRAPLRSISGFARILKDEFSDKIKDEEFDKYASKVISNAMKMENLINDLLNFSRAERQEMIKSEIDMEKMVHEIVAELVPAKLSRKVEFMISSLNPVPGDPGLIRQVWSNLLSNAFKYSSKKEEARIDVRCSVENGEIFYSVSDNGAGFDMKFAEKLFGVFQRLHHASEFEGTGVGLALVKSIVQRHGGRVWAKSEIGKGATFFFSMPLTLTT